jgi:hypothetical protein
MMARKMPFPERFGRPRFKGFAVAGASWEIDQTARAEVRRLIVYLRDRRALYEWDQSERFDWVVASIFKIRERLGEVLEKVPIESATFEALQRMQEACRHFLTATGDLAPSSLEAFYRETMRLRQVFAVELETLGEGLDLSVGSDLTAAITTSLMSPPYFAGEAIELRVEPRHLPGVKQNEPPSDEPEPSG